MAEREHDDEQFRLVGKQPKKIDWEKIGDEASQGPDPTDEPVGSGYDATSGITAGSGTSAADTGLIGTDPMTSGVGGKGRTTQSGTGPGTLGDPALWRNSDDEADGDDESDEPAPRR
jgi:hypothetical protein